MKVLKQDLSRWAVCLGLIVVCSPAVQAKKVTVLQEVLAASDIQVDDRYIYITQQARIFIYSTEDFRLLNQFGKKGEGPREFRLSDDNMVFLKVQPDYLLVNSVGRLSYFTKLGKYQRERINNAGLWLAPIGDGYVGIKRVYDNTNTRYRQLWLFNQNLKKVRMVYEEFDGIQPRLRIIEAVTWPSGIFRVHRDTIFVADKENTIYVYNKKGIKQYEINMSFRRDRITPEVREHYLKYYREDEPYWRERWERLKDWFQFSDYLPVVQYFHVKDGRIYILSHREKDGHPLFYVMDLKGNLIKETYLPLKRGDRRVFNIHPYDINRGILYQIVESEDDDGCELHTFNVF
jgi:hypothetical protein